MAKLILTEMRFVKCHRVLRQRLFSSQKFTEGTTTADDAAAVAAEKLLKKTRFAKLAPQPLFPWRHEEELLDRLIPGTQDFEEKGPLLGGGVSSSNPGLDAFATANMFLNEPLYKIMFFNQWKAALAENFSWAFTQGVSGIFSNVYNVPFVDIAKDDYHLDLTLDTSGEENKENIDEKRKLKDIDFMVEQNLRTLYESAHESGKDQMQVRLETKPVGAHMLNLFCFPFLSRNQLKSNPNLKGRYLEMLELMTHSPREALPYFHRMVADFQESGKMESTVISQVMLSCDELFWVKNLQTGAIVQGHEDGKFRPVYHLVRMEMVVETFPSNKGFLPFKMKPGNWQITDIDDLLGGNLII